VNYAGIDSDSTKTINFSIAPPFWITWWFIILCAGVVFGSVVYFFRVRIHRLKEKYRLVEELSDVKQQALSSQMNPHFIFNSLNSIQRFILENNVDSSNSYLVKFSRLMRQVLNNSREKSITIENEIDTLSLYLELENLRFNDTLNYDFIIDPMVDISDYQIPPLLLQPYVENAIWHGLMHKDEGKKTLEILVNEDENSLFIVIEDNGIGREKAMEIKQSQLHIHKSAGMEITNSRISLTNELYGKNITLNIIDLKDNNGEGTGTRVEIKIPQIL